ncbi:hypothetical protein [Winogradskyella sp.]|uniref:hypothetical protein n=1 Tax=Winogradskyella sp. TaxID=1883156 RepID=UPI00351201DC
MKNIRLILVGFLLIALMGCEEEERGTQFVDNADAPTNVSMQFRTTQDNSGLVTITPTAEGATSFEIDLGDGSGNTVSLEPGQSIDNIYAEGTYTVTAAATSVNGLTTQVEQQLVVSFQAPQNLVVTIENDAAVSKQVNVIATADFAMSYDVYFGEPGNDTPISANIGEGISYVYQEAGTYTITVVAMGSAIETTTYTEDFEVTAIEAPVASAPTPPARVESDVISIFSSVYNDVPGTDYFPDWGQGGQGSAWAMFNLDGDDILQYINLSYQGIALADGTSVDVSQMEYIHLDVWTAEAVTDIETSLINNASGVVAEAPVTTALTPNSWTSIDIPISDYTDQGLTVTEIFQLKFVGTPWAAGTVFIDNIYFWREATGVVTSMIEDFEGAEPAFTVFGDIAPTEVVANPDPSGTNTTNTVAKLTKSSGSQPWAGTFFETAAPIDLVSYGKINVKTWSPTAGAVVKLKLENADASITHEVDLTTTVTNQWENLLYDFSAAPLADYVRIVIFFDFGNSGDDSMYFFDEIELVNDSGAGSLGFQDFEGEAPEFTVFGNIAGIDVIANPDVSGVNTTSTVAKLTKSAGSEVWAGAFFEIAAPLDFNTYSKVSVKTWSPTAGAVVKLKLENADASITHEVDLNTSVANSWEELVYDFSSAPVADYVRVVIFFDFGNPGDDSEYYFDEFALTN